MSMFVSQVETYLVIIKSGKKRLDLHISINKKNSDKTERDGLVCKTSLTTTVIFSN